jgi:hypothetical protein
MFEKRIDDIGGEGINRSAERMFFFIQKWNFLNCLHLRFLNAFSALRLQVNPRKMLTTPSMSDDSTIDPKNFATIRYQRRQTFFVLNGPAEK